MYGYDLDNWCDLYDILCEMVDVKPEALDLAFGISGCSIDTAKDILFYYTGWHNFEGFLEEIFEEN